jgi:hypothetical protein
MIKPSLIICGVLLIFLTASCTNQPEGTANKPVQNGKVVQNDQLKTKINSAPPKIKIEGITYTAQAYVWRDFAPVVITKKDSGKSYRGLRSLNRLIRSDSSKIPGYIKLVKQYVVNNNSIWIANYNQKDRPNLIPYKQVEVSSKGPEWKVGIKVNIGIEVLDKKTDKTFIIFVPHIPIKATS